VVGHGGYRTFRAVSEPLFRFSDEEGLLSVLLLIIVISDMCVRCLSVILFFLSFDDPGFRLLLILVLSTWEITYVLFEYFTQQPKRNRRYSDISLIFVHTITLGLTIISAYAPLLRFKFAFTQVEYLVRLLLSVMALSFALLNSPQPLDSAVSKEVALVVALSLSGVCLITYLIFYWKSASFRQYEEKQRRDRLRRATDIERMKDRKMASLVAEATQKDSGKKLNWAKG